MFAPVTANMNQFLALLASRSCPYAQSSSNCDMQTLSTGPPAIFPEVLDISFSIFSIGVLRFTVISFSFAKCKVVFTELAFFTVITAGLAKQFSSMCLAFSIIQDILSFLNSFSTAGCRCFGIGLLLRCINLAPGLSSIPFLCRPRYDSP